jgi:hypothetical protein
LIKLKNETLFKPYNKKDFREWTESFPESCIESTFVFCAGRALYFPRADVSEILESATFCIPEPGISCRAQRNILSKQDDFSCLFKRKCLSSRARIIIIINV